MPWPSKLGQCQLDPIGIGMNSEFPRWVANQRWRATPARGFINKDPLS